MGDNSECPVSYTMLSGLAILLAVGFNNDICHEVGGKTEMGENNNLPNCAGYFYISLT